MEDEINLRDLIEVLLRGKWLIAAVTLAAVACAAVVSFFVLPPQYEGRATLMVNQPKVAPPQQSSSLDVLLQALSKYPEMTLETYRAQVTNPYVLKQVIEELRLDPQKYTISGLKKAIRTEVVKDTSLIRIIVKGEDPAEVTRIANAVAGCFLDFISGKSQEQLGQSLVFLEEQMAAEEKALEEAVAEYKKFLAQPGGVQELKAEIEARLTLLTEFKNQLTKNEVEISKTKAALQQVESDLAQTPEKLVTKKSLSDDPYLLQVAGDASGSSPGKLSGLSMESEEINEIYIELEKTRADLRAKLADLTGQQKELQVKIDEGQRQLEQLQAELVEKQAVDDRLAQRVENIRNNYKTLSASYEEARLSHSAKLGEASVIFLAPAIEPEEPVGPRKMLNVAVAGVLGVMVSVFAVFFLEFWRRSEPQVPPGAKGLSAQE